MTKFLSLFGLFGPVSILIALVVLALLSQRLGAVTKRAPLYRWIFVSAGLVGLSILGRGISLLLPSGLDANYTVNMLYDILFAAGLSLAVVIAWRYWSWLLSERDKDSHHG